MPRLPELVVDALAVHRLVRLVQADTITARPRAALLRRWKANALSELLVCPWCLSVHAAAAVTVLRVAAPRAWRLIAPALAVSTAASLVAEHLDSGA